MTPYLTEPLDTARCTVAGREKLALMQQQGELAAYQRGLNKALRERRERDARVIRMTQGITKGRT